MWPTMINEAAVYRLAEYPVLERMAQAKTAATQLDARSCRFIYMTNIVDPSTLTEKEKIFYSLLFESFKN